MTGLTKDETKEVVKVALKEWLDEKYLAFGKWALATISASALAALLYFILWAKGWSTSSSVH